MNSYNSHLKLTKDLLEFLRIELIKCVVNLSFAGELEDSFNCFKEGETVEFDIDNFRNFKDPNIQSLIHLIDDIELKYFSLKRA